MLLHRGREKLTYLQFSEHQSYFKSLDLNSLKLSPVQIGHLFFAGLVEGLWREGDPAEYLHKARQSQAGGTDLSPSGQVRRLLPMHCMRCEGKVAFVTSSADWGLSFHTAQSSSVHLGSKMLNHVTSSLHGPRLVKGAQMAKRHFFTQLWKDTVSRSELEFWQLSLSSLKAPATAKERKLPQTHKDHTIS